MLELADGMILYHGSYCKVAKPELEKCAKREDFGRGFYLTSSKEQAVSFLKTSILKAAASGKIGTDQTWGYVSKFRVDLKKELNSYIFQNADVDWLHCITAHRKRNSFNAIEKEMSQYDVIIGKIADDATNATLTAYIAGAFGKIGDREADEFCIGRLLPEKLQNQYCFKTVEALECLKFMEAEKIWLKK